MLYCLVCLDKENAIETRMANREDHLKYVVETDVVKYAGPFLSENEDMIGSLIVIDVEDRAEAEKWSENEKITFLSKEFKSKRPLMSKNISFDKEDKETWSTFKMISKLPRECIGAYIISM